MREYSVDVNETQAKRVALDIARDDVSIPWLVKLIDTAFDNVIRQEDAFAAVSRMFQRHGYTLSHTPTAERPAKAYKPVAADEETLGERIRRLRKAKGWSQTVLSARCGWGSQIRISNYEKGTREPSLDDLRTLAEMLDVELSELVAVQAREPAMTEKTYLDRKHPVVARPGKKSGFRGLAPRIQEDGEDDSLPDARKLQSARNWDPVNVNGPLVLEIVEYNSIPMETLRDDFEVTPEEYDRIKNQEWSDFGARFMHELLNDLRSEYREKKVAKPEADLRVNQMTRGQIAAELRELFAANPWLTKEELINNYEFSEEDYDWVMQDNHTKIPKVAMCGYLNDVRGGIAERAIEVCEGE